MRLISLLLNLALVSCLHAMTVIEIPLGESERQLGIQTSESEDYVRDELITVYDGPMAFDVGPDNTLLFLDTQKERLAIYSADAQLVRTAHLPPQFKDRESSYSALAVLGSGPILLWDSLNPSILLYDGNSVEALRVPFVTARSGELAISHFFRDAFGQPFFMHEGDNTVITVQEKPRFGLRRCAKATQEPWYCTGLDKTPLVSFRAADSGPFMDFVSLRSDEKTSDVLFQWEIPDAMTRLLILGVTPKAMVLGVFEGLDSGDRLTQVRIVDYAGKLLLRHIPGGVVPPWEFNPVAQVRDNKVYLPLFDSERMVLSIEVVDLP